MSDSSGASGSRQTSDSSSPGGSRRNLSDSSSPGGSRQDTTTVSIAGSSSLAAEAGASVAAAGGNAVDAGLATVLVSSITEPGIASPAGGAFVTVWPDDRNPVVIDGYVEMPGRGAPRDHPAEGAIEVRTDYGGGVTTLVGHASVAVPGAIAAIEEAWRRYGRAPWSEVLAPARDIARRGFPLGQAAHHYLEFVHESIFGRFPTSHSALHDATGRLLGVGDTVVVDDLADSLDLLAEEGARAFYEGELARLIVADMQAHGGLLTAADLAAYQPVVREPLTTDLDGWSFATNPPPAIGGTTLTAMLRLSGNRPRGNWSADDVAHVVDVQRAVLGYRRDALDVNDSLALAADRLLAASDIDDVTRLAGAPSTVHASAVDRDGIACAVTSSAGYGSGVIPSGTGIWLNNCLGEVELLPPGLDRLPPGTRLRSNMAPTAGRHRDGTVLAVGSPGADRITTALLCTLLNLVNAGMDLRAAVEHPRLHVDVGARRPTLVYERGLPVDAVGLATREYAEPHMYFGGVTAALAGPGGLVAAADPRRTGGTALGGPPSGASGSRRGTASETGDRSA